MNLSLFILDFVVLLPFTLLRIVLIYMFGSRYNINNFKFFDVLVHAEKPYFNQTDNQNSNKNDTIKEDIRAVIYHDTTFDDIVCDESKSDLFVKLPDNAISELDFEPIEPMYGINKNTNIFKQYTDAITEIDTDAVSSDHINDTNVSTEMVNSVIINALNDLEFDTTDMLDSLDSSVNSPVDLPINIEQNTEIVTNSFVDNLTDEDEENKVVEITTEYPSDKSDEN